MYLTNKVKPFDLRCVNAAVRHAQDEFPNESCGAIINGHYERFENKAEDKENHFVISDDDFKRARIEGRVDCVIHSHNDRDRASHQDQIAQIESDIPFGIINLRNKSPMQVVFWGDSLEQEPFEGRPFFYGVWDCVRLVRDYIYQNTGILTPNEAHEWAFWMKGQPYFENLINSDDFPYTYIDINEIQPGDLLLYNLMGTKVISHVGVYIEQSKALHHFVNQLSGYYSIEYERKYLRGILRYNPNWKGTK